MTKTRIDFTTPVGRLVSGSPFEPQTKDHEGKPLTIKSGPNAGQPTIRYFMALAIPKTDPAVGEFIGNIQAAAAQAFPAMFDPAGTCLRPDFAWKFKDGDSAVPDKKGNKPCDKEGYPGNWIFAFSGAHPPKVHDTDPRVVLTDPNSVKRGYYVRIFGSVVGNDQTANPGVYLNYSGVQLVAYGPEIHVGPDTAAVFAAAPVAQLPPGASATPLAPAAVPGTLDAAGNAAIGVVPAPLATAANTPPPPTNITIGGQTYSLDALRAAGWTEEQINAAGV